MKPIILSDFDGTIVLEDSALYILERFGTGNWRKYDDQLLKGEISLEECLSKQFSTLEVLPEHIMNILEKEIWFRPNFDRFVSYCDQFQIPLLIVSAGLDFIIQHYLNKIEVINPIPLVSGVSKYTSEGITFKFPELKNENAKNFKEDQVINYQKEGYYVTYIGDGSGDFFAAMRADVVYAVKDSDLSRICSKNNVKYHQFVDFDSIIRYLSDSSLGN